MARQAAGAVLAGAAAVCGMLLCGAAPKGKEEPDVRALRRLQVRDKDLPMAFVLPAPKKSAKGPARVKWVFAPVEDKKARTLAPVENERERLAKILEDVEAGKAKIDPGQLAAAGAQLGPRRRARSTSSSTRCASSSRMKRTVRRRS